MILSTSKRSRSHGVAHAEHHNIITTLADVNESTIHWIMGEPYINAIRAIRNDPKHSLKLSTDEFFEKASAWGPNARIAYFWTIANVEHFQKLLDDRVINVMPLTKKWDYESVALLLESIAESGNILKLADPKLLETITPWKFEVKKAYFGAILNSNLPTQLTNPDLVHTLTKALEAGKEKKVNAYLWYIGTSGQFVDFDSWKPQLA